MDTAFSTPLSSNFRGACYNLWYCRVKSFLENISIFLNSGKGNAILTRLTKKKGTVRLFRKHYGSQNSHTPPNVVCRLYGNLLLPCQHRRPLRLASGSRPGGPQQIRLSQLEEHQMEKSFYHAP